MSQSFAKLFKNSKFSQYDPKVKQIISTFGEAKKQGDWGLKRNLPTTWRSGYITVDAIDTPESLTPFNGAYHQILHNKQFAENFGTPAGSKWTGVKIDTPKSYTTLGSEQFKELIEEAHARSDEWKEYKKDVTDVSAAWKSFLNVTETLETKLTQAPLVYCSTLGSKTEVKGRILNKVGPNTYIVGVSGFTCLLALGSKSSQLSHSDSFSYNQNKLIDANNHSLRTFYVNDFSVSANNKVTVRLSLSENNVKLDGASKVLLSQYFNTLLTSVDKLKNNPKGLKFGLGQSRFKKPNAKFEIGQVGNKEKANNLKGNKNLDGNAFSQILANINLNKNKKE
jgi:hypothetical protein